jgi:hypothetical protein
LCPHLGGFITGTLPNVAATTAKRQNGPTVISDETPEQATQCDRRGGKPDATVHTALLAAAMTLAVAADAKAFDAPESKLFTTRDFKLESGVVLPELTLAYETYGTLAPDGRNAVLHTHGYTGSHHAAGTYGATGAGKGHKAGDVGSWDKLIGPGKAIDTSRLFVVASNMLGSSYGSTNPATINPKTSKPYGPDFPRTPSATSCGRRRPCSTIWASSISLPWSAPPMAAIRRSNGR